MTAPVEHLLKVFRKYLPNNVAALARTDPLAATVPRILNPMMRELIDDSESRRGLAAAPAFPCKLRKLSVATNTKQNSTRGVVSTFIGTTGNDNNISSSSKANNSIIVENETNIALWSAVLPWETSLGLSHVKLNSYYSRGEADATTEENKTLQNIPRGMLFVSRGIEEATSDLNGEFVKWAPNQSFWSGAIRQSIDVLFLQSKKPIPKKATLARRDDGEIAAVLSDPFRNGYGCRVQDVQRLDPFERFNTNEQDENASTRDAALSPEGKNSEKSKKSLPQHVYDLVFDENSSSSRSYSVLCPKSANAPFFVLELPGGFTEEKIIRPASSSSSSSSSYVELELGEEICKDIDTKMMIERHFVPVLKAATNEILKRMCREVLQRGAKYVLEEMEGQRRNEEVKLGFGKTNDDKKTSDENVGKIIHEWSDEDTEFLCMSTRLSLADFELNGTAWDVLADYISRYDEKVLQQQQQQQHGENGEKVKFFFDKLPHSFDQIWKLMNDGSLCLPDSIMRLMIQEQSKREDEKFKL